jgi:PPK2 family polyphosphate:nucleotide phosphotransferase
MDDGELIRRARRVRAALRVPADGPDLAGLDPGSTPGLAAEVANAAAGDLKGWARADLARLGPVLAERQERLYAQAQGERAAGRRRMLLVLQSMDCGGKDGAIKSLARAVNPQGVRIVAFGPPTPEERGHHFLWRIARALPAAGYLGVFNRSHYEDVLVARVRSLVPEPVWRRRYDEINRFEADLAADGLTIVKVMLHISPEEQRERLLARLDDPTKRWKYHPDDLLDRARWPLFQEAYAEALSRCATPEAPWYVVPADRKWYRNWAVAHLVAAHLADLPLDYPEPDFDVAEQKRRLDAGSPGGHRKGNSK